MRWFALVGVYPFSLMVIVIMLKLFLPGREDRLLISVKALKETIICSQTSYISAYPYGISLNREPGVETFSTWKKKLIFPNPYPRNSFQKLWYCIAYDMFVLCRDVKRQSPLCVYVFLFPVRQYVYIYDSVELTSILHFPESRSYKYNPKSSSSSVPTHIYTCLLIDRI